MLYIKPGRSSLQEREGASHCVSPFGQFSQKKEAKQEAAVGKNISKFSGNTIQQCCQLKLTPMQDPAFSLLWQFFHYASSVDEFAFNRTCTVKKDGTVAGSIPSFIQKQG